MFKYEIHGPDGIYKRSGIWAHQWQAQCAAAYWLNVFSKETKQSNLRIVWL